MAPTEILPLPPSPTVAPQPAAAPPTAPRRKGLNPLFIVLPVLGLLMVVAAGGGWWLLHWLRTRAAAQQAAVATQPTAAPSVAPTLAAVVVLGAPWGELTSLRGADGHEVALPQNRETPLFLTLPPGHYVATLSHPGAAQPATCEVDAELGKQVTCRAELLAIDPMQYFKETGWWR